MIFPLILAGVVALHFAGPRDIKTWLKVPHGNYILNVGNHVAVISDGLPGYKIEFFDAQKALKSSREKGPGGALVGYDDDSVLFDSFRSGIDRVSLSQSEVTRRSALDGQVILIQDDFIVMKITFFFHWHYSFHVCGYYK